MSSLGPFRTGTYNGHEVGHTDVESRLRVVKTFSVSQCLAALAMPELQQTVHRAVQRRLRKLSRLGRS